MRFEKWTDCFKAGWDKVPPSQQTAFYLHVSFGKFVSRKKNSSAMFEICFEISSKLDIYLLCFLSGWHPLPLDKYVNHLRQVLFRTRECMISASLRNVKTLQRKLSLFTAWYPENESRLTQRTRSLNETAQVWRGLNAASVPQLVLVIHEKCVTPFRCLHTPAAQRKVASTALAGKNLKKGDMRQTPFQSMCRQDLWTRDKPCHPGLLTLQFPFKLHPGLSNESL